MNLKNLLNNKVYIYSSNDSEQELENLDLIKSIFNHANFNFQIENNLKLLDINYDYDIYKFKIGDRDFVLKISENDLLNILKDEFDLINNINSSLLQMTFKNDIFKDKDYISYSIFSFENEPSLKDMGSSYYINNYELFFDCLSHINEKPIAKYNLDDLFFDFFQDMDLSNIFNEDLLFNNLDFDLNKMDSFITNIKNEIKYYLTKTKNYNKLLCHGNLNTSNILCGDGYYKFINLTNAFNGHEYYDICDIFLNSKMPILLEKDYFFNYLKYKNNNFESKEWELYKNFYNILIRKNLIENIFSFFIEKYVFSFSRQLKARSIINDFILQSDHFLKIQSFKENYKLITDLFVD